MGQMVLIDENELEELKMSKAIANQYRKTFDRVYPVLFSEVNNFILDEKLSNPIRNWEYDCYLLEDIAKNISNNKRRKKHKLWQR